MMSEKNIKKEKFKVITNTQELDIGRVVVTIYLNDGTYFKEVHEGFVKENKKYINLFTGKPSKTLKKEENAVYNFMSYPVTHNTVLKDHYQKDFYIFTKPSIGANVYGLGRQFVQYDKQQIKKIEAEQQKNTVSKKVSKIVEYKN